MKVLHINASYKPAHIYGGPTMSVAMLCEQLNIAGVNASVFTTTANGENELPVITGQRVNVEGVEVTYFKRITKDHTHFSPQLLKNLWSEVSNFDAIHIHAWWNLVSVLSCLIAVLKNVPVILSPRGTLSTYSFNNKNAGAKKLIHRSLGKYLLKRITVHATSVHEKEILTGIVPAENISILPNFVRLPVKEYPVKKEWSGVLKLLFLSRIEPKKGLDLLIDALKDIQVPWHLTIAGSGNNDYVDQLKTMAQPYINNKQVIWLGFQDESKFNLFYNNDLMILPSHDENFGNVVIESLSVGTPVLVSDKVGLAGYVADNKLGWICSTNAASISGTINDIGTKHAAALNEMSACAPVKIKEDFNNTKLVSKYIHLYNKTISNG